MVARNEKAPAYEAGASNRVLTEARHIDSLTRFRRQVVITSFAVPSELVAAVAALAFSGGAHG